MAFRRVKGTVDYFPEDRLLQNMVFDIFRSAAIRYGFSEVEAPALESMPLLAAKSGEEIKKQIFTLDKRSGEELGMRFEFTASLARMFVERQKSLAKPVKWFSLGRMWRYEQPQAGRLREFYQFNAEIFGSGRPESDAEAISLAIESLKALGLTKKDFFVNINNRKLLQGLLLDIIPKSRLADVLRAIDKREKITEQEFDKELSFLEKQKIIKIKELLQQDLDALDYSSMNNMAREGYDELKSVLGFLGRDIVRFSISTARGLAYYTGTVFEVYDAKGKYRALAGGGRYDRMIELFGGQSTPATGFAMGYATLLLLLKEKGLLPKISLGPDYYIAVVSDDIRKEALKLASGLRKKYSVDIDLMKRTLSKQLKYADSIGARKVIVLGPDELKSREVKIKDMATGKEKRIKISSLIQS